MIGRFIGVGPGRSNEFGRGLRVRAFPARIMQVRGSRDYLRGEGALGDRRFVVELVKPSHYDDDGYVIQWWKSWIPSNSLACLYGIATDIAARRALGPDVAIEIHAYDECHTVIPIRRIIRRIKAADAGLVCLVGVQSNQFPRAMALAASVSRRRASRLRSAGSMFPAVWQCCRACQPISMRRGSLASHCLPVRPRGGSTGSSPMRSPGG